MTTADGGQVTHAPDYATYPFDFVHLLAVAVRTAHGEAQQAILAALEHVDIRGANGHGRGFNENNHDGVVDDDVFFGVFHDLTWTPVKDDPLSSTLQTIPQTM